MFRPLIRSIQEIVEERQPRRLRVPGVIVSINGSTSPPNRPNYTFVRLDLFGESTVYPAFNNTSLNVEGLWVEVEISVEDEIYVRVIGVHISTILPSESTDTSRFTVPKHGPNHQYPTEITIGPDPVLIFQPALQMLKTTGDGVSLTVSVQPLVYGEAGTYRSFPGQTLDLTSYVPSTATRVRQVLIYLNKTTNAATALAGAEAINNSVAPVEYPAVPAGGLGSAYVKLVTGQTAVTTATDILDIRRFMTESDSAVRNQANQVGDILISLNGQTFEPGLPVVDAYGDIMTNADGTIMVW